MTTKNTLVARIARITGHHHTEIKEIVQLAIDGIIETLATEERLELRNFGVLTVKRRRARKARNPKTEVVVDVPERKTISFKPGKFMKDRVNGLVPAAPSLGAGTGGGLDGRGGDPGGGGGDNAGAGGE